ncbi:hypothetical protein AB0383_20240 [Amycolatopsis sp. NPDC051373]|uniref:hypothetical protein n=1 Tax=Amycolatopsis sp. NPDC051373 TaxID=3155801 RepID=UPI00344EDFF8
MNVYEYYATYGNDKIYRYLVGGNGFGEWRMENSAIGWITTGTQPAALLAAGARRLDSAPEWAVDL